MGESKLDTNAVNVAYNYRIDDDNKIIYLSKEHLKKVERKLIEKSGNYLYHIDYNYSVRAYVRGSLEKYTYIGYKVILKHGEKKLLLLYND